MIHKVFSILVEKNKSNKIYILTCYKKVKKIKRIRNFKVNCYNKIKTKRPVGNIITIIYSKLLFRSVRPQDTHYHLTVFVFWLKRTKVSVVVWERFSVKRGNFLVIARKSSYGCVNKLLKGVELMNFLSGTLIQLHCNLDNKFTILTSY